MDCTSPKFVWPHRSVEWCDANEEKPVQVRCGKCIPCLVSKRNDWSFRLEQEYKYSSANALFVTLTYDQKHLPSDLSVDKRHLQLFFKRLRKRDGSNSLRYFAVGEYGTHYGRPHYHILLFGANSEDVRKSWIDSRSNPIGNVHIGKVTSASVAYVTKYVVQSVGAIEGRAKPFTLMSRKYGIGGKYLTDEMVAWHREDDRNYCIRDGQKINLPRFYKDKIFYGKQKERVSKAAGLRAIEQKEKERQYYEKEYGEAWFEQLMLARHSEIERVKTKVQYTQTF